MVSILDVGDAHEEVPIRGKNVSVTGISGQGIVAILQEFPDLRKIIANRGDDVSAETLLKLAPDAAAAAMAAGCGSPGNKKAIAICAALGVGEQLNLLEAIFRITFPDGVGPFVQKLMRLADVASKDVPDVSGWAQGMKLPAPSNSSFHPATRQT